MSKNIKNLRNASAVLVLAGATFMLFSCGTAASQEPAPKAPQAPADTGPDENTDKAPPQEEIEEKEEEAVPAEPVLVTVVLKIPGKGEVDGTFTITSIEDEGVQVATDRKAGTTVEIKPGFYNISAKTPHVLGSPVVTIEEEDVPAGVEEVKKVVEFPVGTVNLRTMKRGRCRPMGLSLRQGDGDWIEPKSLKTCQDVTLMAGQWEAEIHLDKKHAFAVEFYVNEGGSSSIPVDISN